MKEFLEQLRQEILEARGRVPPSDEDLFIARLTVGEYFALSDEEQEELWDELSLVTFGTDEAGEILSVSVIVTFDQRLANKYTHELTVIQDRFEAMVAGLEPPFCYARLPEVMLPQKALGLIQ